MKNLSDVYLPTVNYYLTECPAPAVIPVDVVDYAGKGYAYRVYHDDIKELSDGKQEDFANWLIGQAKKAEKIIGLPVTTEVSVYE